MIHKRRIYRHHTTNYTDIHVQNVTNNGKIHNLDNFNEFIDKRSNSKKVFKFSNFKCTILYIYVLFRKKN